MSDSGVLNTDITTAFLSAALENLSEGVVACNAAGVLTIFNRATREFHDLPRQPIPSDQWAQYYRLFHADGETPLKSDEIPLIRALNGEIIRDVELVIVGKNKKRIVLCNGEAIFDDSGKKLGAVIAMHDITELKKVTDQLNSLNRDLEERVHQRTTELQSSNIRLSREANVREKTETALLESEKRFRALFEQAPLSVQLLSVDGRTTRVNQAWKKLWGFPEDVIQNFILKEYNILQDQQLEERGIMKYIKDGFNGQSRVIPAILYDPAELGKEGRKRWVEGQITPVFDENGNVAEVVIIHQDVTEKIEFQNELKMAKDAAEEANRLKSAFLANMSHEIRTPLGAILGFSELLKDPKIAADEMREYIDIIDRSGKALTKIIDDILDLSKVEAGRLQIEMVSIDLNNLLNEVVSLLKIQAIKQVLKISASTLPENQSRIRTDSTRLRQILINLVGNAVKFTQRGEVKIVPSLTLENEKQILKISVIDTGIGIQPDQQSGLFQPFNQLDNSRTRQFGGTGLGLALSKRLAQAMNGDVFLEKSEIGKGSTFTITLPYVSVSSTSLTAPLDPIIDPASELVKMRVLLVDDSEDNRKLVVRMLSKKGAYIDEASDGAEGVAKAISGNFDLILMDIQMPIMDGFEAIRTIRAKKLSTPIIALTAHAMPEERDRCLAAGADAHLSKPINTEELYRLIHSFKRPS